MTWTPALYTTNTLALAEGENAGRFTAGYTSAQLDLAYARAWRRIVDKEPGYRVTRNVVTLDVNASIQTAALPPILGSGGGTDRFHRMLDPNVVMKLRLNTQNDKLYDLVVNGSTVTFPAAGPSATGVICWVNTIPQSFLNVPTDGTVQVPFPDGYELLVCYWAAAFILSKGAVETGAATQLLAFGDSILSDLLQDIRGSTKPQTFSSGDRLQDWTAGGNW